MLHSAEIRWFVPGQIPQAVLDWFGAGHALKPEEKRIDEYLMFPDCDTVGVKLRQGKPNFVLSTREVDRHCAPDAHGAELLKQAISRLGLSARAYHRVLKIARTIADLTAAGKVTGAHVAEAIQYRRFDRG